LRNSHQYEEDFAGLMGRLDDEDDDVRAQLARRNKLVSPAYKTALYTHRQKSPVYPYAKQPACRRALYSTQNSPMKSSDVMLCVRN